MMDVKVDDEVVIYTPNYRGQGTTSTAIVKKVARKYFYVATEMWYDDVGFEIADGTEKQTNPHYPQNYARRAFTAQGWLDHQLHQNALRELRELGVSFGGKVREKSLTTQQILGIIEILEGP